MRVINKRAALDAAQQARLAGNLDLIPTHVRRLYRGREARALAGEKSGARRLRGLCAALKKPLHAHTDSQKRLSGSDTFKHGGSKILIQRLAAAEVANSGNNGLLRSSDHGRIVRNLPFRTQVLERFFHRADVARTVIDDRDHRSPLVLGSILASWRSREHATRNARANALNSASIL